METKMETAEDLKEIVREKYGRLAREGGSCCGPTSCCGPSNGDAPFVRINEDYTRREGYIKDADLGLGCGIPIDAADLHPGQTVVDLGSGAGNDAFVARRIVGETGKVIGVDMTPDMIKKARENAVKVGYANVEFRLGEIEALPVSGDSADRVISNCVLNLVPDKKNAFVEMHRILKPGGKFGVSDVVLEGDFPEELRRAAELYAGCVSGAMRKRDYLASLEEIGFEDIRVTGEKVLEVPEDLLAAYLSGEQRKSLAQSGVRVLSITLQGTKPRKQASSACCTPLDSAGDGPCCHPLR
ncbi:MAG TPA: arsenite methyltransferase [Fibrobacteria bacterium]|nr:arsenite methyltransferase [Fibrobacteria bacterium]